MAKSTDTYGEPVVYDYGNVIVRVFTPILTPEERERRMEKIREATADLLRATYAAEAKREAEARAQEEKKKEEDVI